MWRMRVWDVGSAAERTGHLEQNPMPESDQFQERPRQPAGGRPVHGGLLQGICPSPWLFPAAAHLLSGAVRSCPGPALAPSWPIGPPACFLAEPGLMWVWAPGVWHHTALLPSFILLPSSPLGSASTCFAPLCVPGTAGVGIGILERQDSVWRCLHWELLLWWEKGEGYSKCKGDPCSLHPWTSNQHSVINLMVSKENERKWSCSVVSDSLLPHGLWPTRLLHSWDFPGKGTGVGCHFLLQEIFPTQGSNPGLLKCRQMLYLLSHQGSVK